MRVSPPQRKIRFQLGAVQMEESSTASISSAYNFVTTLLNTVINANYFRPIIGDDNYDRLLGIDVVCRRVCSGPALTLNELSEAGALDVFKRTAALLEEVLHPILPFSASYDEEQLLHAQGNAAAIFGKYSLALVEEQEELYLLSKALELKQQAPLFLVFGNQIVTAQHAGHGMYGDVFRVIYPTDGQPYALKLIRQFTGQFDLELTVLKMLTHPNIARYYLNYISPRCYILEWISGGDLRSLLLTNAGLFNDGNVIEIMHQLASALSYMHGKGLLHRDLKLDNVMVVGSPDRIGIKIIDLGLAYILQGSEYCQQFAGSLGTASYEKLKQLPFDGRDDVYAIGRIVLMLLMGRV
jgi:hypothetical protein